MEYKLINSCIHEVSFYVHEILMADLVTGQQPAETLEHYYLRQEVKPSLLINAAFFNMATGEPVMTVIDDQVVKSMCELTEGLGLLNNGLPVAGDYNTLVQRYGNQLRDFCSGYPVLIRDGQIVNTPVGAELNSPNRRTIVALKNTEMGVQVFLYSIDLPGMSLDSMRVLLKVKGVDYAVNLDGGGSTGLLIDGIRKDKASYSRPVDTLLAIYLQRRIGFRVQAGAYRPQYRYLADRLLVKIQSQGGFYADVYKTAKVYYFDGYYKVQVGCFLARSAAEALKADLCSRGFNAIVTTVLL